MFCVQGCRKKSRTQLRAREEETSPTCPHRGTNSLQKAESNWSAPDQRNVSAPLYWLLGRADQLANKAAPPGTQYPYFGTVECRFLCHNPNATNSCCANLNTTANGCVKAMDWHTKEKQKQNRKEQDQNTFKYYLRSPLNNFT